MLDTRATNQASLAIDDVSGTIYLVHATLAHGHARATQHAPIAHKGQLGFSASRFGAVTPPAGKWAPFEVHRQADPRPVVDGKGVDVKDEPLDVGGGHERASWRRM